MNKMYVEDLINSINNISNISILKNKTIFIAGANGMIGSFIVDLLMYLNNNQNYNINIVANGRNEESLNIRFKDYLNNNLFCKYVNDVNNDIKYSGKIDYIINCASNTHPKQYASDPIGTILTNINGLRNLLELAKTNKAKFIFLSSVEIYGENRNKIGKFKENSMGYIDCNTLRAGYNEAKRTGEALCQAYKEKHDLSFCIIRLPRIYGPTIKKDDSKALSQFINKALLGENIVLKSEGNQFFSYLYVADAVSGILHVMMNGKNGEAYNIANEESDVYLKDLARLIADKVGTKVIFDLPNANEKKGFSSADDARLDYSKIQNELNWSPLYNINIGIERTISIIKNEDNL